MTSLPFYLVDVFAEEKYAGNQLAVFRGAAGLAPETMQRIAKEINFAETSFILTDEEVQGGYEVRIYTPDKELAFAGHPTLGTASVIHREIAGGSPQEVRLNLRVGQIPVAFADDGFLWMKQNPPVFGQLHAPAVLAAILGLSPEDIDSRWPVQTVSTGLPSIIIPLVSRDAVKRCRIQHDKFRAFAAEGFSGTLLVFCPEPYQAENDLNVRVFTDDFGYPEDAATGSANGNLAGYLLACGYFGKDQLEYRVEQGFEMGRPALLKVKARKQGETWDIQVGGRVISVAKGEWSAD